MKRKKQSEAQVNAELKEYLIKELQNDNVGEVFCHLLQTSTARMIVDQFCQSGRMREIVAAALTHYEELQAGADSCGRSSTWEFVGMESDIYVRHLLSLKQELDSIPEFWDWIKSQNAQMID